MAKGLLSWSAKDIQAGFFLPYILTYINQFQGKLQVHSTPINEDKCKCEGKLFGKGRRKRCRCIKPQCSNDFKDGKCNSGCCDKRRCRERASKRQRQSCELK